VFFEQPLSWRNVYDYILQNFADDLEKPFLFLTTCWRLCRPLIIANTWIYYDNQVNFSLGTV